MGGRGSGRRPLSATARRLRGTRDRGQVGAGPDFAPGDDLKPPKWFKAAARQEWDRIVPELQRTGVAKAVHQGPLEAICMMFGAAVELHRKGDFGGARRCMASYRLGLGDFGLTPASATRVTGSPAGGSDPADEFFGPKLVG